MAYTYRIGWSAVNKHYYGVRFAKTAHPDDLWVTYFTSSKAVKKFRKENGEPDIIEIRRIFDDPVAARKWETRVIQKLEMVSSTVWLNQTDNTSKWYSRGELSEETKAKISAAKRGKKGHKLSEEHKRKLKEGSLKANAARVYGESPFKGKKHSPETQEKMKASRNKMSASLKNKIAQKGGAKSAASYKKNPTRQKEHSERMKQWWADRKAAIGV